MSGGRDSNSRHSAWKADALPTELPPHNKNQHKTFRGTKLEIYPQMLILKKSSLTSYNGGGGGIRTYSALSTRFTVWPGSPTPGHPQLVRFIITQKLNCENYVSTPKLSHWRDSNPRPADYKSAALPTELQWLILFFHFGEVYW